MTTNYPEVNFFLINFQIVSNQVYFAFVDPHVLLVVYLRKQDTNTYKNIGDKKITDISQKLSF